MVIILIHITVINITTKKFNIVYFKLQNPFLSLIQIINRVYKITLNITFGSCVDNEGNAPEILTALSPSWQSFQNALDYNKLVCIQNNYHLHIVIILFSP